MALDSGGGAPAREEPAASQEANRGDEIRAVAQKVSDQPLQNSDPSVWAVLTAISKKARQRPQGMHILLSGNEHLLGRTVEDIRFQVSGQAISSNHCKIFRKRVTTTTDGEATNSSNAPVSVFLKDTSTNGTFLNWVKLRKDSAQAKLQHGDIISFAFAPHDEEYGPESKRLKGIGIGAPEGPISLDDVRSLQRSNTELRQQLESHVHTIETMRNEHRTTISLHENSCYLFGRKRRVADIPTNHPFFILMGTEGITAHLKYDPDSFPLVLLVYRWLACLTGSQGSMVPLGGPAVSPP